MADTDALRVGFALLLGLFGLSALVGWATAFRNRLYLACVGVTFMALAGGLLITGEALGAVRIVLWVIAGLTFVYGLWLAVADVRRQLKGIEEQRRGLEREMQEYLTHLQVEQGKGREGTKQEDKPTP
jgi:uncharacterized membrane protein